MNPGVEICELRSALVQAGISTAKDAKNAKKSHSLSETVWEISELQVPPLRACGAPVGMTNR